MGKSGSPIKGRLLLDSVRWPLTTRHVLPQCDSISTALRLWTILSTSPRVWTTAIISEIDIAPPPHTPPPPTHTKSDVVLRHFDSQLRTHGGRSSVFDCPDVFFTRAGLPRRFARTASRPGLNPESCGRRSTLWAVAVARDGVNGAVVSLGRWVASESEQKVGTNVRLVETQYTPFKHDGLVAIGRRMGRDISGEFRTRPRRLRSST